MTTTDTLQVAKSHEAGVLRGFLTIEQVKAGEVLRVTVHQSQLPMIAAAIVATAADIIPACDRGELMLACVGAAEEALDAYRRH